MLSINLRRAIEERIDMDKYRKHRHIKETLMGKSSIHPWGYDDDWWRDDDSCYGRGRVDQNGQPTHATTDKNAIINTFLHYSDPTARFERTVFGTAKPKLFYNYSDRLYSAKWSEGIDIALKQATPKTARFFEIALKHFHDSDDVDLQHIILGCNMRNGYDYLVFGYTYTSKSNQ